MATWTLRNADRRRRAAVDGDGGPQQCLADLVLRAAVTHGRTHVQLHPAARRPRHEPAIAVSRLASSMASSAMVLNEIVGAVGRRFCHWQTNIDPMTVSTRP